MQKINKLLLAGVVFGGMALGNLTASVANIQGSATVTLVALPPAVTVSTATPVAFGNRNIPRQGERDAQFTIDAIGTDSGQGSVTIDNGTDTATYSLTLGVANCDRGVTFSPSAAYDGSVVNSGGTLSYVTRSKTLSLGGTLTVPAAATAGHAVCTFNVNLVNVDS